MIENIVWWLLVSIAGIIGIFTPMVMIVAAQDMARQLPPLLAGSLCALGVTAALLGLSLHPDDTFAFLDVASAGLWLIALVVIGLAYWRGHRRDQP